MLSGQHGTSVNHSHISIFHHPAQEATVERVNADGQEERGGGEVEEDWGGESGALEGEHQFLKHARRNLYVVVQDVTDEVLSGEGGGEDKLQLLPQRQCLEPFVCRSAAVHGDDNHAKVGEGGGTHNY
eukprot:scaffold35011_cov57-Phaeocystis_antarctica.AAC.6